MIESIGAAIASLKTATDIARGIVAAAVSVEKAEIKLKIADIANGLADARMALLEANDEIERLNARVRELEDQAAVHVNAVERDSVYYVKQGDEERGPYCSPCYLGDKKLIPLSGLSRDFQFTGSRYQCPKCKAVQGKVSRG